MRLLPVVYGTLAVFLDVHCPPYDQHLVQFGMIEAHGPRLGQTEFYESVDQYPAHWLHPQSSASVLCAVRVHQDRQDGEGQVEVEREVGEDQGETLIMA